MEISSLLKLKKENIAEYGQKASLLGELSSNFNIPEGFVIGAKVFQQFIDETNLTGEIGKLLGEIDTKNYTELHNQASEIQKLIISTEMPEQITEEILEFYQTLSDVDTLKKDSSKNAKSKTDKSKNEPIDEPFVAVRSSPNIYIAPRTHLVFLNVTGEQALLKMIKASWASLFSPKALHYYLSNNLLQQANMAVIVQKMLKTDQAAKVSTVSSKSKNEIVIGACYGLGEAISSGLISPDRYVVNKLTKKISFDIHTQSIKLICDPDAKTTIKMDISQANAEKQKLDDRQIIELADASKRIESFYNSPQKIDFAYHDKKLYVLEVMPVPKELIPVGNAEELIQESDDIEEKTDGFTEETNKIDNNIDEVDNAAFEEHEQPQVLQTEEARYEIPSQAPQKSQIKVEALSSHTEYKKAPATPAASTPKVSFSKLTEELYNRSKALKAAKEIKQPFIAKEIVSQIVSSAEKQDYSNQDTKISEGVSQEIKASLSEENKHEEQILPKPTDDHFKQHPKNNESTNYNEPNELNIDEAKEADKVQQTQTYQNFEYQLTKEEENLLKNLPINDDEGNEKTYVIKEENKQKQEDVNLMLEEVEEKSQETYDGKYEEEYDYQQVLEQLEQIGKESEHSDKHSSNNDKNSNQKHSAQRDINKKLEKEIEEKNIGLSDIQTEVYSEPEEETSAEHQQKVNKEVEQALEEVYEGVAEEEESNEGEEDSGESYEFELTPEEEHAVQYETDAVVVKDDEYNKLNKELKKEYKKEEHYHEHNREPHHETISEEKLNDELIENIQKNNNEDEKENNNNFNEPKEENNNNFNEPNDDNSNNEYNNLESDEDNKGKHHKEDDDNEDDDSDNKDKDREEERANGNRKKDSGFYSFGF
ncbi:hypothetical protein HY636_02590 [Candidatus Woesearchaeota archaeon]|nr:hypothetical protein [Candidatus Woesearchaeota archaeon]